MRFQNEKGISLVEVLISVLLLTIILAAGQNFYFNASAIMAQAMHKKIAMEMANQQMETNRVNGYASLPNPATGNWENPVAVSFADFTANARRRVTDLGTPPQKKVEIEVKWLESGKQDQRVINLATYVSP